MQFYHSKLLSNVSNITHVFTTQASGNLAFHVNDNPNNIRHNHIELAKALNYNYKTLVHMKQIHSNKVHIVNKNDDFLNPPTCDAIITSSLNTPLMVMVADCSPILFFDKVQNVIAVAHAGRQGTFNNIVKNVINSFKNNYASNTQDIIVVVGPSIKKCCYEVGDEIFEESCKLHLEYAIQSIDARYYLDISKILKTQLIDAGIQEQNIDMSKECTCCKKDKVNCEAREGSLGYKVNCEAREGSLGYKYYSYRAQKDCGRFSGVILLK